MCFPTWSDPAVFAGLLDSGGVCRVAPTDSFVTGGYYEERLAHLAQPLRHRTTASSSHAMRSSFPGSAERAILLRRVSAVDGAGDMVIEFAPANDYGRRNALGLAA